LLQAFDVLWCLPTVPTQAVLDIFLQRKIVKGCTANYPNTYYMAMVGVILYMFLHNLIMAIMAMHYVRNSRQL